MGHGRGSPDRPRTGLRRARAAGEAARFHASRAPGASSAGAGSATTREPRAHPARRPPTCPSPGHLSGPAGARRVGRARRRGTPAASGAPRAAPPRARPARWGPTRLGPLSTRTRCALQPSLQTSHPPDGPRVRPGPSPAIPGPRTGSAASGHHRRPDSRAGASAAILDAGAGGRGRASPAEPRSRRGLGGPGPRVPRGVPRRRPCSGPTHPEAEPLLGVSVAPRNLVPLSSNIEPCSGYNVADCSVALCIHLDPAGLGIETVDKRRKLSVGKGLPATGLM